MSSKEYPASYFWVGDRSHEMDDEFFQSLKQIDGAFASKLKKAVGVANRHDLGVIINLADPDDLSKVSTHFISHIDQSLMMDEAMILAVEMFDIFHNNAHIIQLPIELGYGRRVYLSTAASGQEADAAIIILNKKGEYLTSYDHTRNEFFPTKLKSITKKQQAQLEGYLAETLGSLYQKLCTNINEIREEMDKEKAEC